MSYHLHSLAAHTGTRIDSAAKHNMACKVDTDLVKAWMQDADNANNLDHRLHVEKMRYCVHKDELVMSTNQKVVDPAAKFSAYPLIVSNVVDIPPKVKARLFLLYARQTFQDWSRFIIALKRECRDNAHLHGNNRRLLEHVCNITGLLPAAESAACGDPPDEPVKRMLNAMPVFVPQGYALGVGYASHVSGDTVCTVQIGGMMTVMNGAFTCHTGDLVQWYFTGEENMFYKSDTAGELEGQRINQLRWAGHVPPVVRPGQREERRHDYHDHRMFGMQADSDKHKRRAVFRLKPYRRFAHDGAGPNMHDHFGDKMRVFAKCIGGAKPYEMMDIMLMTQSL